MSGKRPAEYLSGITVVEIGGRLSAGVCGSLLAEIGADVFFVEPPAEASIASDKWASRNLFAAGKHSIVFNPADDRGDEMLLRLVQSADVILLSSDVDSAYEDTLVAAWRKTAIVCDFTAFGKEGPLADKPFSDVMVQAVSGVAHTTGLADGPPVVLRVPVMEYSTAVYGAAAVIAALTARDRTGEIQTIDMALYDCAVNSLATFLPVHFGGGAPARVGNQHTMGVPWNAYRARDGWILICSASDPPWQRICDVMGTPQWAEDPKYATLNARLAHKDEVDQIVQEWVGRHDVALCIEKLMASDIACGPILKIEDTAQDPNLQHRSSIQHLDDPLSGKRVRIPGALLRTDTCHGRIPKRIPEPGDARAFAESFIQAKHDNRHPYPEADGPALPLQGIRILEIGQYTTAPLSCRHLATLGAEVLKIEPLEGDAARKWPPHIGDESLFFTMSNSGKTSLAIDLQSEKGQEIFAQLVESADVLVENLKPGSLARRGFDWKRLAQINSRLIYCAISGFGADSAYGQRPAFDTVLQAMTGMMDANAFEGMPLKAGVSVCDFMGGEIGLFFVLAALRNRQRTGKGDFVDISMQDVSVWMTATLWDTNATSDLENQMLKCADGYVLACGSMDQMKDLVDDARWSQLTRTDALDVLSARKVKCAPVRTIAEMLEHPQTKARSLMLSKQDKSGLSWPLLGSPLKLSTTQPLIDSLIGRPEKVDASVLDRLKV